MSVQATSPTAVPLATTAAAATTGTTTAASTTSATTAATADTVTLSDEAIAASNNSSGGSITSQQFSDLLHQLNSQINGYEHQVTYQLDRGQDVTLAPGVSGEALTEPTTAAKIAATFAGLQSNVSSSVTNLTPDQAAQLKAAQDKLASEQKRFQQFAAKREGDDLTTAPQYNAAIRLLKSKLNGYEHQVTYQIDHNTAVTKPIGDAAVDITDAATAAVSNTSTGTTTTAAGNTSTGTTTTATTTSTATTTAENDVTIAAGFASLEASFSAKIATLPLQFTTEFQQFQAKLAAEQQRFTAFAASRVASKASATTGTTQDVAA